MMNAARAAHAIGVAEEQRARRALEAAVAEMRKQEVPHARIDAYLVACATEGRVLEPQDRTRERAERSVR